MVRALLGWVLLCVCTAASSEVLSVEVIGISDGDTVAVVDAAFRKHKIRLAGKIIPCFALRHKFRGRHTSSNALSLHLRNCMQLQNGLIRAQITESTPSGQWRNAPKHGRKRSFATASSKGNGSNLS
jgi:hypothetical protein